MRIAFVSDIHSGPETVECRPGREALPLLERFIDIAREERADAIIDLGDRVNNTDHAADLGNLEAVASAFASSGIKAYHVIGNHDVHFLTTDDNVRVLGLPAPYYSAVLDGFRLIFLDTSEVLEGGRGGISSAQMDWLASELSQDDGLVPLVFSHHPLCLQDQRGNPFFVNHPDEYSVAERDLIADIIGRGRVPVCFSGHTHWMYTCRADGTSFLCLPSLLESYPVLSPAPGRFCIADVSEDGMVDISEEMLVPRRTLGRHIL